MTTTPTVADIAILAGAFASYSAFTWLFLRALIAWDGWLAKSNLSGRDPGLSAEVENDCGHPRQRHEPLSR